MIAIMSRLQNMVFVVLFMTIMGLLAWLSNRYPYEFDLTWGNRNSLTETSVRLVQQLDKPVKVTAFARDDNKSIRDLIEKIIGRYQRHKSDMKVEYLNPDLVPQLVSEHGITVDGELLVQYGKRQETTQNISEKSITQLLMRLSTETSRYVAFIQGHGERDLLGTANHDFGTFGQQLNNKGFNLQPLILATTQGIADNIQVLVIASPRTGYLPGELKLIAQYVDKGSNLLLMVDPDTGESLEPLLAALDIQRLPGVVVDATTRLLGISNPTFALAIDYPRHPVTESLHSQTIFPRASGLIAAEESDWRATSFIQTLPKSWTETDALLSGQQNITFDPETEEHAGPINIGYALERPIENIDDGKTVSQTQRIIVMGDSDFLSNSYIGNGQNQDLGTAILQWLSHNDAQIDIGIVSAPDAQLQITPPGALALLLVFIILLPLTLLGMGVVIWLKRRRR